MKSQISVYVMVPDVELDDVSSIRQSIDDIFRDYENVRVTITISDQTRSGTRPITRIT